MRNDILKGVFLVALGATSYGMLATFVKLAYKDGFTTAEVTSSQFIYGIIGVLIINLFQKFNNKEKAVQASAKNIIGTLGKVSRGRPARCASAPSHQDANDTRWRCIDPPRQAAPSKK
mgnify:CR=1 FL=1